MAPVPSPAIGGGSIATAARRAAGYAPGLLLAVAIAWAARLLDGTFALPSVFLALAFGMAMAGFATRGPAEPGIEMGSRGVLRIGVALLGVQVTFADLAGLGLGSFFLAVGAVAVTLCAGYPIGRAVGLGKGPALLAAGGVAICGASAILAIAAVLPKKEAGSEDVAATVAAVTILGTVAMIAYPALAAALGLGPTEIGIFLGASLHEVVQAVGAGFSVSDPAGETATAVKLIRVACLAPVVILVGWAAQRRAGGASTARVPILPYFLVGFAALATLSSLGLLPRHWVDALAEASRWCLLVGIASLGAKLSFARLCAVGPRQMLALLLQSLLLAAFALTALMAMARA
jgi:uncharacterized integral membrane protein (TIGR00698 family)